jgi:hypothetical protein
MEKNEKQKRCKNGTRKNKDGICVAIDTNKKTTRKRGVNVKMVSPDSTLSAPLELSLPSVSTLTESLKPSLPSVSTLTNSIKSSKSSISTLTASPENASYSHEPNMTMEEEEAVEIEENVPKEDTLPFDPSDRFANAAATFAAGVLPVDVKVRPPITTV